MLWGSLGLTLWDLYEKVNANSSRTNHDRNSSLLRELENKSCRMSSSGQPHLQASGHHDQACQLLISSRRKVGKVTRSPPKSLATPFSHLCATCPTCMVPGCTREVITPAAWILSSTAVSELPTLLSVTPYPCSVGKLNKLISSWGDLWWNHTLVCYWDFIKNGET